MSDFDGLLEPTPRPASPSEESRLRAAFDALLEKNPNTPPGPKALCAALGWSTRQMNGRTSKLRRKWLREAGFRQSAWNGRWGK